MWAIWAVGACAWAAAEHSAHASVAPVVTVEPRQSVPILLITPPGFDSVLRGSDVIDATARVLDRVSGVEGLSPEQAGLALDALDRCTVDDRFACAVRLIRDLPPATRTNGWAVLVLRRPSADGDERLDVQLLDIDAAARALGRAAPGEAVEDAIFRHVRAMPPVMRGHARDASSLAAVMEGTIARALGELLPPVGRGELRLSVDCAPCDVAFEGRWLARIEGGELGLRQVPTGPRHLTLTRDAEARDYPVTIVAGTIVHLDARDFGTHPSPGVSPGVLLGAGAAAAVVGVALMVVARSTSAGVVCLEAAADGCESLGPWVRVGGGPLAETSWDPLLITGASLAGAGLSWGGAGIASDGLAPLWAVLVATLGASTGAAIALVGSAP